MNKLLQTTLITAILSTGVMAGENTEVIFLDPSSTGALPRTIESGAEVEINDSIAIAQTITNRGTIKINNSTTPITISRDSNYPTLGTQENAIIDNAPYIAIEKFAEQVELDGETLTQDAILTANEITYDRNTIVDDQEITGRVSPENVYILNPDTEGKIVVTNDANLTLDNVEIKSIPDPWILYTKSSFSTQDETNGSASRKLDKRDLLFLGRDTVSAEKPANVIIQVEEYGLKETHIACHFGNTIGKDENEDPKYATPYNLEIQKTVYMAGNVENYKGNVILENSVDGFEPRLIFAYEANVILETMSINVTNPNGELRFTSTGGKVNSNIDCNGKIVFERNARNLEIGGNINTNAVEFHNTVTLKSGAKLIIGKSE